MAKTSPTTEDRQLRDPPPTQKATRTLGAAAGQCENGGPSATVKKLSEQQIIGQQGVHLLSGRLLSVGLSFNPRARSTPASTDS
jgi:hypothetical protein